MKKFYLMAIAALMATMSVNAQSEDYKHDIAISYGWLSNSDILDIYENIGGAIVGERTDNDKFFGPLSVEYFYHVKPWLGVGAIAAYGSMKQDYYLGSKSDGKDGEIKNNYFTLMPAVKFDWLRKSHFGLYSKLGFGATLRTEKMDNTTGNDNNDSEFHVNWQVSVLGFEFGGQQVRGFVELGTGEQGIFSAGVRAKF